MSVINHTVERYYIAGFSVNKDDRFVKASDYDALASVCRELMPFVQAAIEDTNSKVIEAWGKRLKAKALALLDGEKNEAKR